MSDAPKPLTEEEEQNRRGMIGRRVLWPSMTMEDEARLWATLDAERARAEKAEAALAEERRMRLDSQELHERQRIMHAKIPARPILYTDVLGENQVCRDDLWAVTTEELNKLAAWRAECKAWRAADDAKTERERLPELSEARRVRARNEAADE